LAGRRPRPHRHHGGRRPIRAPDARDRRSARARHRPAPRIPRERRLNPAPSAFSRPARAWRWLSGVLGVRGDKERSVDYSRRAVAISPTRLDYQVELGAGLLCLRTHDDRAELVREGMEVLKHSESLTPFVEVRNDRSYARLLIEQPERACSYTRDGWIKVDEATSRAARAGAAGG